MGKNVPKNFEKGWSLSLSSENLTREDLKSLACDLFFLGNHYKYVPEDLKIHGTMTTKPFMVDVDEVWSLYEKDYSPINEGGNSKTAVANDYTEEQCIIQEADFLDLITEGGWLNENLIAFVWHW